MERREGGGTNGPRCKVGKGKKGKGEEGGTGREGGGRGWFSSLMVVNDSDTFPI